MSAASASSASATVAPLTETSHWPALSSGTAGPEPKPAAHPAVVLIVLCVAQFISALDVFIVNVALPKIGVGRSNRRGRRGASSSSSWYVTHLNEGERASGISLSRRWRTCLIMRPNSKRSRS
jgi:hypothetical protein